ncbi:MAG: ImmA/IrrE family metallo-endopeptidase [Methanobrevibacter sp.]|nr:ImmA/IrrE family metallo-endopeptidase [Methanobrevibacter sp.]MBQ6628873.1 ImmA/IrrE family metallo-endopeptidase [Methanobrevibacter sp.]
MVSSEIIFKAETIRRSWGIDNVSPINILSAVLDNVDNLTILWFPMLDDVSGCCAKTDEYKLICINSRHSKGRQNFTIAHELYHLLFEDDINSFICNFNSDDESEINADKFASSLLMPDIALFEFINKHGIKKWSLSDVIKCEQYFQISHIAMLCKLRREDMISYDDFKAFKTSVKKNALQLGYDLSLYEPTRQYYSLGEIIPLSKKLYDEKRITGGKFDEILLDVFREDLVYNTFEEDDMIV